MLEIGAHIGTQTLQFAESGLFRKVISVEPVPDNLEALSHNVKINGLEETVTIVPCAIGEEPGTASMYFDTFNSGGHSLREPEGETGAQSVQVEVLDVARLLSTRANVPASDVGCLWIDAEGFEFEILRSVLNAGIRDALFNVEFTPRFYGERKKAEFIAFLETNFSSLHVVSDGRLVPARFDELFSAANHQDIVLVN
ncbi:FkbM family methyltransferase [Oricola thermophila]|uniref:FkbM family methyltransferase n=1 Tax=Oricola thermophila TaxID=2742145 RepID=A0A6N1VGN8_9HYPH|nr:FkbM family methyltransferase [Oricola thermophila]QKV18329.1 FkbM family methyltransferase [Oricola thermophila]